MTLLRSFEPDFLAALTGYVEGKIAKNVYILGRRSTFNSTTVFQDVCTYLVGGQNGMNTPAVGTTYYLNSTSANDTAAGTGTRTVRTVYLDASGNQQVRTDVLNGTTAVSIGAGYTAIQWCENATVGTNLTAVGDITISSVNGAATEATTMEMIRAGGNRSLSGRYQVPTGYSFYLIGWYSAAINRWMDTRLRVDVFSDDRTTSPGVFHFNGTMFLAADVSLDKDLHYLKCIAGSIIKISTIPEATAGSARIDASIHGILIQN